MRKIILTIILILISVAIAVALIVRSGTNQKQHQIAGRSSLSKCSGIAKAIPDRLNCITNATVALLKNNSYQHALQKVERAARSNEQFALVCHQAMHRTAAKIDTVRISDVSDLAETRGACSSGFVHGIFQKLVTGSNAKNSIQGKQVCAQLLAATASDHLAARECYHGLGHGVRRNTTLKAALETCKTTLLKRPAVVKCFGGAFMEDQFANKRTSLPPTPSLGICQGNEPDAQMACFAFAYPFAGQPEKIGSWCELATADAAQQLCFASFGRTLPATFASTCVQFGYDSAVRSCLKGYLRGNIYEGRTLKMDDALRECSNMAIPYSQSCAAELGAVANIVDSEHKLDWCEKFVDTQLSSTCRDATKAPFVDSMDPTLI